MSPPTLCQFMIRGLIFDTTVASQLTSFGWFVEHRLCQNIVVRANVDVKSDVWILEIITASAYISRSCENHFILLLFVVHIACRLDNAVIFI